MTLFQIASEVALIQPLSDRRDYGSGDPYQTERLNEWQNTDNGSKLLNNTYRLQELAEGANSESDLEDLQIALNEMSEQAKSVLEFVE